METNTALSEIDRLPTVADYTTRHPRAYLTAALDDSGWPQETRIIVGSGIITDNPNSHICRAVAKAQKCGGSGEYVTGGMAGKTRSCGHWFAVRAS